MSETQLRRLDRNKMSIEVSKMVNEGLAEIMDRVIQRDDFEGFTEDQLKMAMLVGVESWSMRTMRAQNQKIGQA